MLETVILLTEKHMESEILSYAAESMLISVMYRKMHLERNILSECV